MSEQETARADFEAILAELEAAEPLTAQEGRARIDLAALMQVAHILQATIRTTNKATRLRLAALAERVEQLEAQPRGLQDRGVWRGHEPYERGDAVSHQGSLWIAREPSQGARPGTEGGAQYWRLAAKAGGGGRDFRP